MLSFRNVSAGETAFPRFIGAMRIEQNLSLAGSPMDSLLKRPAREPWPPAQRACAPEGNEEVSTLFRKI
ncbi:MAG: hypothetical protein ACQEQO_06840 [Thermodesulfobacteriota bacterium]